MPEIQFTDTSIIIKLDKSPIPPVRKALKENGFICHNCVWRAKRTPANEFFTKLTFSHDKTEETKPLLSERISSAEAKKESETPDNASRDSRDIENER